MMSLSTLATGLRRHVWRPRSLWALPLLGGLVLAWPYLVPSPVPALHATPQQLSVRWRGAGELSARNQARLASPATLRLTELLADTGDQVRRGQPLMQLDIRELQAQAEAARAAWRSAQSAAQAQTLIQARLQALQQHAQADAERALDLTRRDPGNLSLSDLDASHASAQAATLEAQAAQAQAAAAAQAVTQSWQTLEAAQSRLAQARLSAPFDGLVTERSCSVGDTVSPTTPCLVLTELASLYVSTRFDESVLGSLAVGDAATVTLKSSPAQVLTGRVARINRNVDRDTREFTVDVSLDALPPGWALGGQATVQVQPRPQAAALTLPRSAIAPRASAQGVWLAEEGRARWVPVQLGRGSSTQVEVLSGVTAQSLVLEPQLQPQPLREGQRVSPQLLATATPR